jgi:hypothetical protein
MGVKLLNLILFQVAWFAAVLGAARGIPWLGPLALVPVLGVNLALSDQRSAELKLVLVSLLLGFLFDTALVAAGVFMPVQHLFPRPYSPPWMMGLWVNFALTLNVSLDWLRERLLLSALFGAIGGPLAYYGGARLGATDTVPTTLGLVVLALGWGIMTPLLFRLATHFRRSP